MNSTTESTAEIDQVTSAAIRKALSAAQMGRIGEACATAEHALAEGGDPIALNAMLGMLRGKAGDPKGAIRHLEIAHRAKPTDIRIATNLASALAAEGELAQAFKVATPALAFSDPTLQLARIRGYIAQMLEDPASAADAYEHVISAVPDDWESWNNLGNARNAIDDIDGSIKALERAAEINPEAAPTRLNLARTYRHAGRLEEAEEQLRKMADDFPEDTKSLLDLHDLLKLRGGNDDELLGILDRAVQREPENIELSIARARQLGLMLDMERAEAAFRSVLEREPANAAAFVGLATVYEHSRASALLELAAEAERSAVEPNALNLVRAFAYRRAKRYAEGVAAIEKVPAEFESGRSEHLLGQLLEGLGNHDEAFAAYVRMNQTQSEDPSEPLTRAEAVRAQLRDQLDRTTSGWINSWKASPLKPERPAPVFLVGFPRSGTTLLDTILMGHPDVEVMEERPVISRVDTEFGGFEAIPGLDEAQVRQAQNRYFEVAGEYADVDRGALLVDKSPLLLNQVPTIYRLFPNARFILALRHPADVILSCFVSNFRLNSAMANFLRLDTAAEFYDLTFKNWENSRALFPIEVHTIVYENLVDNPEAELRRISEALGLRWYDGMLDHTKTAAARGVITTASYAQVTEPIYRRSIGRWERYRAHLEPILPLLSPWAEKFGYSF